VEEETIKADVLCIGGGIAGLMAAIRASELGAKVIIAEKGNTLSSGSGGIGSQAFECYIPEIHGPDMEVFIRELLRGQKSDRSYDVDLLRIQYARAFDIVQLWDTWGIPMRYKGRWEFATHSFPGRMLTHLKYSGRMEKAVLTKQALDRGVKIVNRVMVFDLLCDDGTVIGAIGAHTREDKVTVFQAKSVIIGTGVCERLYPAPGPGLMFNLASRPTCTGDGRAMAYRAGAELLNLEIPRRHIGPKYFVRGGQAAWVGVLRDPYNNPVGTFVTKPDRRYGDIMCEVNKLVAEQYTKSGKGPVYMDCRGIIDEDYEYMMHWMKHEGNTSLFDHIEEEGIDIRKNPIEFMTYQMRTSGGIAVNIVNAETSLKGLYAAGDELVGGGISSAAVYGWISGENAANYTNNVEVPDAEMARTKIEEVKKSIGQIRGRENGPDWREVNIALQQTMYDYVGSVRYENLLKAGLHHLRRLREKASATMIASNPHELGRCLEVLNLLDIGELVLIAAGDRKETRGLHIRPDYPFTNPLLNTFHIIKKMDDKPVTEWRETGR